MSNRHDILGYTMNRNRSLSVIIIVLVVVAQSGFSQILDRPAATVNLTETAPISLRVFRSQIEFLEAQYGRPLTQPERMEVLDAQIGDELLNQAARRDGVTVSTTEVEQAISVQRQSLGAVVSDAQFRSIIQQQTGLSWESYREQIRNRLIQERFVISRSQNLLSAITQPTQREVRRFYEENAPEFTSPAMVRFDHLFFDTRAKTAADQQEIRRKAGEIASAIRAGRSSFDVELEKSLDDVSVGGGDFGYLIRTDPQAIEQLGRNFVDEVFELERNDVSGVLASNVGFHIVRIRDRRSPRLLELDDPVMPGEQVTVRDQVEAYLVAQKQQTVFQQALELTLAELRGAAEVEIFEEYLNW